MQEEKMFYENIDFDVDLYGDKVRAVNKLEGKHLANPTIENTGWGETIASGPGVKISCPTNGVICPQWGTDVSGVGTFYLDVVMPVNSNGLVLVIHTEETLSVLGDHHVVGNVYMPRRQIEANMRAVERGEPDNRRFPGFFDDIRHGFGNYHG